MNEVLTPLEVAQWDARLPAAEAARATRELESGKVIYLPRLRFEFLATEARFLAPAWTDRTAKNIAFDPVAAQVRHTSAQGHDREQLAAMMARFAGLARELVLSVCPAYACGLRYGLSSLRPVQAHGRPASRTKDDTLLHIDAFASRPTRGQRILRVFCNVNPDDQTRVWEIGEPFETVASRFQARIPRQMPGTAWLLERMSVTKQRRSEYDHIMLQLHDTLKRDEAYQRNTHKTRVEFPAGSTWIVFSDRVMHAALAGQHLLEQTFYLPVSAMQDERHAPLRVLEALYGRTLA
jgi:hypothetical protein